MAPDYVARAYGMQSDKIRETPNPALNSQGYLNDYNSRTVSNYGNQRSKYSSSTIDSKCYN